MNPKFGAFMEISELVILYLFCHVKCIVNQIVMFLHFRDIRVYDCLVNFMKCSIHLLLNILNQYSEFYVAMNLWLIIKFRYFRGVVYQITKRVAISYYATCIYAIDERALKD